MNQIRESKRSQVGKSACSDREIYQNKTTRRSNGGARKSVLSTYGNVKAPSLRVQIWTKSEYVFHSGFQRQYKINNIKLLDFKNAFIRTPITITFIGPRWTWILYKIILLYNIGTINSPILFKYTLFYVIYHDIIWWVCYRFSPSLCHRP